MGGRTYQRILECSECRRVPEHGEPMWEMGGEHWCEECCDKDEEEVEEIPQFAGTTAALNNLTIRKAK